MTIHTAKVSSALSKYRQNQLPEPKTETIQVKKNLVDYYEGVRKEVKGDDNSALDADPRDGVVEYESGDRIGFTYNLGQDSMRSIIERKGYTAVEEFQFSDDGIERVSVHHDVMGPAKGSMSVDKITADGSSLTRQSWWFNVEPQMAQIFTPNFEA